MNALFELKDKYWISCSPLARVKKECWTVAVYKKSKISWVTEECNSFSCPEDAYEWGFNKIEEIKAKYANKL